MANPAYALPPKPGTYRIVSMAARNNVIAVPPWNQERVVCSTWEDKPRQRWFIQYSGRGYKIKNVEYGGYLAASSVKTGAEVGTNTEPTVWTLLRVDIRRLVARIARSRIQYGDEDLVVDLDYALEISGNGIHLWPSYNCPNHRRWSFEHLSDDVGGEVADTVEDQVKHLREQLQSQATNHYFEKLALARDKDRQLAEKEQQFQAAFQAQVSGQSETLRIIGELRQKVEELEQLSQFRAMHPGRERSNNTS